MKKSYHEYMRGEIVKVIDAASPDCFYTCYVKVLVLRELGKICMHAIDNVLREKFTVTPDGFNATIECEKYLEAAKLYIESLRQTIMDAYGIEEEQLRLIELAVMIETESPGFILPYVKNHKDFSLAHLMKQ